MRMENEVETAMRKEIDELSRMTVGQLRQKYLGVFGEESRSNHKQFLFRRIAVSFRHACVGGGSGVNCGGWDHSLTYFASRESISSPTP